MRKIVVTEFVTLDGVMEDPGGSEGTKHGGWALKIDRGDEGNKFKLDELFASDALLLGRVTYQGFAQAWPSRTDDIGFAHKMNGMTKYVVSKTLTDAEAAWNNTRVIRGDLAAEVARLKARPGGDLLVEGSSQLVQWLIRHGLVDEYRLMVFPIVLGSGKRLFSDPGDSANLKLTSASSAGAGVLMLTYQAAPSEARRPAAVGAAR